MKKGASDMSRFYNAFPGGEDLEWGWIMRKNTLKK